MATLHETLVTNRGERDREKPFLQRVRLRCQRRVLWLRTLWANDASAVDPALAISHDEVDRLLASPGDVLARESNFYQTNLQARDLTDRIREADQSDARDPAWIQLRRQFDLSEAESDLLALCAAAEADPQLRRVYAYVQDDATAGYATCWLASGLFQWPAGVTPGPESSLAQWLMACPAAGTANPWSPTAPWIADPHMVLWLTHGAAPDALLATTVQSRSAAECRKLPCLYPAELTSIRDFISALGATAPVEINLVGGPGIGKRTLASQVAAQLGRDLICADAATLLAGDVPFTTAVERAIRAIRLAHLAGAFLYWQEAEAANAKIWSACSGRAALVFLGSALALPSEPETAARRTVPVPPLARSNRIALWTHITGQIPPDFIANSPLEPAGLCDAARLTVAGVAPSASSLHGDLKLESNDLLAPLVCPYTWDDIVLTVPVRDHLQELERQVRLRWQVYDDWGFHRLCPLGRGITAMFAGPSGTGKTMAAQVLAGSLGMQLYRVDLAGVINKYIGETEKSLRRVFDACERADVVLFFDEADALFGQRTQVKDAHDRFANIEIDYLLQRIEQFNGVVLLATNRKGDLDKAFLRRLRFIVDFVPPGPGDRLEMWHRALHARTPAGEELLDRIDWDYLAHKLTLTGADIRAAALSAAFLARAEGTRIGMTHILHAAQREGDKNGTTIRSDGWGGK